MNNWPSKVVKAAAGKLDDSEPGLNENEFIESSDRKVISKSTRNPPPCPAPIIMSAWVMSVQICNLWVLIITA